jgi:prolyl 4-hydroxylase
MAMSFSSWPRAADEIFERAMAAHGAGRHEEAVRLLGQAGQAGHVPAMTLLGGQLLSGRGVPPDPPTGLRLIFEAAERGGGYACSLAAAVLAAGVVDRPEWNGALDYLQRGAELGHPSAQDQLRILAALSGPPPARAASWETLRRAVDLDAWRAAPPSRPLSEDPRIRVVDGFLPGAVCDWLIARARERLQPAQVFDTAAFRPVRNETRTNSFAPFDIVGLDLAALLVRERLAASAGLDVTTFEAPQVLHYAVGQQFAPHFDFLQPEVAGHAGSLAHRGQRVATLLVYLNEAFEGGETDFPELGLRYRGRTGDALLFWNVDATGAPDQRLLHAGLPPTSGEKWLFSQWVRQGLRQDDAPRDPQGVKIS